jgi:ABC-type phosphate transport system substrate-binding protein
MGRFWSIGLALVVLTSATMAREARAQDCVFPANKVLIAGSTAIQPLIKGASGPLVTVGDIDVYYANLGSCTGTVDFVTGLDLGGKTAAHFDAAGVATNCTIPAGTKADLGVSDVFYASCGMGALPAGFADTQGPVQGMSFVVPRMSTQYGLVAEEGYFVFGFGTAGYQGMTVAPWSDQTKFAIRNAGSGTQQMTARAVGLSDGALMKGVDSMNSAGVSTALGMANVSAAAAEPAIGILASADYDNARMTLKTLAFQAFKQIHGYLPDFTETSFDKRNIREGKYAVWGPSHIIAAVGSDGKSTNPRVQNLIDYISLAKPLGPASLLDVTINAHLVPQCAMKVKRTEEIGPLSPSGVAAPNGCGCYMEEKLAAGSSGCTACTSDATCGTKKCNTGFCE